MFDNGFRIRSSQYLKSTLYCTADRRVAAVHRTKIMEYIMLQVLESDLRPLASNNISICISSCSTKLQSPLITCRGANKSTLERLFISIMNNIDPGDASVDVLAVLQEQLEARSKPTVVIESTVLIIIDVTALVGNATLCFVVCRSSRLHTPTTMLIVALAFTDLLTAAFVMPLTIDAAIHSKRRFSDAVCKAHAFAMAFLAQVSIFTMALTAFNRYLCVSKRNLYRKSSPRSTRSSSSVAFGL